MSEAAPLRRRHSAHSDRARREVKVDREEMLLRVEAAIILTLSIAALAAVVWGLVR